MPAKGDSVISVQALRGALPVLEESLQNNLREASNDEEKGVLEVVPRVLLLGQL